MRDKRKIIDAAKKIPDDQLIDTKRDTTIRHLENPDPVLARLRESARAQAQVSPYRGCPHPISAIAQFVDRTGTSERLDRPTNLFQCDLCKSLMRLCDWYGNEASDA